MARVSAGRLEHSRARNDGTFGARRKRIPGQGIELPTRPARRRRCKPKLTTIENQTARKHKPVAARRQWRAFVRPEWADYRWQPGVGQSDCTAFPCGRGKRGDVRARWGGAGSDTGRAKGKSRPGDEERGPNSARRACARRWTCKNPGEDL